MTSAISRRGTLHVGPGPWHKVPFPAGQSGATPRRLALSAREIAPSAKGLRYDLSTQLRVVPSRVEGRADADRFSHAPSGLPEGSITDDRAGVVSVRWPTALQYPQCAEERDVRQHEANQCRSDGGGCSARRPNAARL
jgi:hypothetical protein